MTVGRHDNNKKYMSKELLLDISDLVTRWLSGLQIREYNKMDYSDQKNKKILIDEEVVLREEQLKIELSRGVLSINRNL